MILRFLSVFLLFFTLYNHSVYSQNNAVKQSQSSNPKFLGEENKEERISSQLQYAQSIMSRQSDKAFKIKMGNYYIKTQHYYIKTEDFKHKIPHLK